MNAIAENRFAEERIRKLTQIMVPVCWGSIAVMVLIALAGILFSLRFGGISQAEKAVVTGAFLLPLLYWSALLILMLQFLRSCSQDGAFTRRGRSRLRLMAGIIVFVGVLKLLYTVAGALWIAASVPMAWTTILLQVAPIITNILLGVFLFLLSVVLEMASSLKEENELTI